MKTWGFYDPQTGILTSRKLVSSSNAVLADNTPPGLVAIEGRFDELSQRVDLETKQVVDWQPPQPSSDHEWNSDRRRWVKRAEVLAREAEYARAMAELQQLDAKQVRPLAELAIDPDNIEARERLVDIEAEKAVARATISGLLLSHG